MQTLSLVLGILSFTGMIVGFFPCLGAFNWINIPFAFAGLVVCIVTVSISKPRDSNAGSITGIILCSIAIIIGIFRLIIGGGIL